MSQKIRSFSSRILIIVLVSFVLTSAYYVYSLYRFEIDAAERSTLLRLESIAKTISSEINGTILKMILETYENKGDIDTRYDDAYIREIGEKLQLAAKLNNLPTDIYTLTYDSLSGQVFFGISSAEKQYFRHEYNHPPEVLLNKYEEGAMIPMYKDENGTWLSAFAPIKDANGDVIGVVQADMPFDQFLMDAKKDLYQNILISILLISVIAGLMLYWLRKLLTREERLMLQLSVNNEIINKKNEDITSSILYAKRIQKSLMDSENKLKYLMPESFVVYKPKDIVSGDFYWIQSMNDQNTRIAIATADCTGHGVPGALVSVLGITFLRDIVTRDKSIKPAAILEELNSRIIETFKSKDSGLTAKDGMDISFIIVDTELKTVEFAGAYRPLLHIRNEELNEIQADKYPIGGDHFSEERTFTDHTVNYESGDFFVMFSDGYIDQFGGNNNKKFMKKKFKRLVVEHCEKECSEISGILKKELKEWQGEIDQVDDITVLGIRL